MKTKKRKPSIKNEIERLELINANYEILNNQISIKEYRRHKKIQSMIHKRKSWRDYTV